MSVLTQEQVYGEEPPEKDNPSYHHMDKGIIQKTQTKTGQPYSDTSSELSESLREKILGMPMAKCKNQAHGKGAEYPVDEQYLNGGWDESEEGTGWEDGRCGAGPCGRCGSAGHPGTQGTAADSGHRGASGDGRSRGRSAGTRRECCYNDNQVQTTESCCRCSEWRRKCECDDSNCRCNESRNQELSVRDNAYKNFHQSIQLPCSSTLSSNMSGTTASRNLDINTDSSTQTCCCNKTKPQRKEKECHCHRQHYPNCRHQCCYCRSKWQETYESSSETELSEESASINFIDLPYQNNDEYMELLRELESKLVARNKERVRKTRQEFEIRSRQNKNLDKPICNYDGDCGCDEDPSLLQQITNRNRKHCCTCCCTRSKSLSRNSDIFQNEKRWGCGQMNFVEAVVKSMDPNQQEQAQKYPKFERSLRRSHWQMDPRTGEWVKVASYQQMDYCPRPYREEQDVPTSPRCKSSDHHRRHRRRRT